MKNPFAIVQDFESALCEYTGASYAVAVNSCTNALFLALVAQKKKSGLFAHWATTITIPKCTYISVPMQIVHAGYDVEFRDEDWLGMYRLEPFNIWDSARWLTRDMYVKAQMRYPKGVRVDMGYQTDPIMCLSFHWSKTLGIQQGGAILHNDYRLDEWLRKARFDGRTENIYPKDDTFDMLGYHMYMSPEIAAEGLVRIRLLKDSNPPLPNDDYPDLSKMELFK